MSQIAWFRRDLIEQHSLDMRQFVGFRESRLANGMRLIEGYNASGLHVSLLPDRGLDMWTASYRGIPLTWIAPDSPKVSDSGQTWLEQFNGGLLTTCGLTHVGPPETDPETDEKRGIHGKYTRLPAQSIQITPFRWDETGATGQVRVDADVYQSSLFGPQLHLHRCIALSATAPEISLSDTVHNQSDTAVPLMLLYHCNVGYPLVQDGAALLVASDVYPRDDDAKVGANTWSRYDVATDEYPEQVFFHHMRHTTQDDGFLEATLTSETIGLMLRWQADQMPYFTQWKNTRSGIYVCGLEPGNCIPEGQHAARESGRLQMLEPGEMAEFNLSMRLVDDTMLQTVRERVTERNQSGDAVTGCDLSGYDSSPST